MLQGTLLRASTWLVLLLFPAAPLMGDVQAAMLYAKGNATVNGRAVPGPTALFPGDRIRTTEDSAATIVFQGTSVVLTAGASVVYEGAVVEIERGSAVVTTAKGFSTRAGNLTIAPATGGTARYQVTQMNGKAQVAALEGDVAISDGKTMLLVKRGQAFSSEGQALGSVPAASSNLAPIAIVLIVMAVAGAAAGIAVAATGEESPTSP